MDRLELLQAVIAEQRRRWTEKYGWVKPEDCRQPTWQEEMDADAEREMLREYRVFMRQHLAAIAAKESASADAEQEDADADEGQRNNRPT
ncbi:hypothetical protein [Ralstonia solanacearum]|uniref:hypothetical protein n=1 Tax=Ralstonia solanacearum TaxID=305 RepID=UPI0012D45577|nr:hypothetical protein [Ralstonia solanacearum]MDC6180623.1 hypothetical protein [Ralstonia solanacearum]MDC6210373.1 hypothetical protein [Ralstonia solanacearum]MDC6242216.1 hypothetical protein [Ralstonia solanacearum]MDD7800192.1 hypothetical protein [Ralstonia solanacearum]